MHRIFVVGNKIGDSRIENFCKSMWPGFLPYDENIIEADLRGETPYDQDTPAKTVVREIT